MLLMTHLSNLYVGLKNQFECIWLKMDTLYAFQPSPPIILFKFDQKLKINGTSSWS